MTAPAGNASQHGRLATQRLAGLASLSPSYFAMVMATGVVSLAAYLQGYDLVARALFGLNGVIWLLTPKFGRDGALEPADVADAASTSGLRRTTTVTLKNWQAVRLVAR